MPNAQTLKYLDEADDPRDDRGFELDFDLSDEDEDGNAGAGAGAGPYPARNRLTRLKLRGHRVPFVYRVTEKEQYENIDRTRGPLGMLAFEDHQASGSTPQSKEKQVQSMILPTNVRYAGGYTWKGVPVTVQDVVEEREGKRSQGKRFVTPGIPDILDEFRAAGKLDSDRRLGYVDFVLDCKDMSIVHDRSPFEPIFHSLSSTSILDGLDLVLDLSTLWLLVDLMLRPEAQAVRIDAKVVGQIVFFHHWVPSIMLGPGEAHRGYVQHYTQRVTRRNANERREGGTTQLVRYDLGSGRGPIRSGMDVHVQSSSTVSVVQIVVRTPRRDCRLSPNEISLIETNLYTSKSIPSTPPTANLTTWSYSLDSSYLKRVNAFSRLTRRDSSTSPTTLPNLVDTSDRRFDEARKSLRGVFPLMMDLLKRMIGVSKLHKGVVSFVSEPAGMNVWRYDGEGRGRGPLSNAAQNMLRAAKPSTLAQGFSPSKPIPGYKIEKKAKTIGDWAAMNASTCNANTSTWGPQTGTRW